MAGNGPDMGFVHELMQQAEHHRVARVRTQERRIRIAMNRAAEQLGGIRIICQTLRKRLRAEVEPAAGRMRPTVDVLVRCVHDLVGHLEGHGLPGFQRHLDRLSGGLPASITLTVCGTVSWMETINSRKLPLTPAPIGSLL